MAWETFDVEHDNVRSIIISSELNDKINKFIEITGIHRSNLFDMAIVRLWRIWNGGTTEDGPDGSLSSMKVRNILLKHPMPGKIDYKNKHFLYAGFKGEQTYKFGHELQSLYFVSSITDLIRRTVTWFINEHFKDITNEEKR